MKIAMIASNRKPVPSALDNVFAPGVIIKGLVDNLTAMGHSITFFGPQGSDVNAERIITENLKSVYEEYSSIRVSEPYKFMEIEDQYEMVLLSKAFEIIKQEGDFDLVHVHKHNKEIYFSNFIDTPMLITGHGMYCESLQSDADRIKFEKYKSKCYWVYVSEYHKKDVDLNFISKIPWGVDGSLFPYNEKSGEELIFISRLIERKRPDFAIKVAGMSDKRIMIAGNVGINPAHVDYFNQIKPLLESNFVNFLGHIPYNQTFKYIGNALALLLPIDIGEPMPVTALEAMACGTPIIASNISPMDEIVVHGETGYLVDKDDANAWVDAIKNIKQISRKKCRERYEQYFTMEKMAQNYEATYQKVVDDYKHREAG